MIAQLYILLIVLIFIYIWAKHFYLVHVILNNYMKTKYGNEWDNMKNDTSWYRPPWATLYFSKSIYDFIWKSDFDFKDKNLMILKKRIKRIGLELPIFFIFVFFSTILFIHLGWLQ